MTKESKRGHGCPPTSTQFKPGMSGNPKGRPKGSRNLGTDLNELMTKFVAVREDGKRKRITRQQAMLLSLYDKALHGDVKAINAIVNMIGKLNPTGAADIKPEEEISQGDAEIVAEFLRRNQPTQS